MYSENWEDTAMLTLTFENGVVATLDSLASLTAELEPIMIVTLGFIVGFIVISMFLPLANVISKLSSGAGDDSGGKSE